jgi:tetratricopeptide (TPR) repeat protein
MAFLRNFVFIIALLMSGIVQAQITDKMAKAFSESLTLEKNKKYAEAASKLSEAYSKDSYEFNLRLGWLFYNAAMYPESEIYYQRSIDLMPYSVEPKLGLVLPKSALNKWDEVESIYKKILEVMPDNTYVLYNLSLIYYNRGDYTIANPMLQKVINLYPTDYESMILFGWNNLKLGKFREAKLMFQKVLLLYPGDTSATDGLKLIK